MTIYSPLRSQSCQFLPKIEREKPNPGMSWAELVESERNPKPKKQIPQGRPDQYWPKVKTLLERHGGLTSGDVATLAGMGTKQARDYMTHAQQCGRVKSEPTKGGYVIWSLT